MSRSPDTYQVLVNNIGVKPAGVIATKALQKSSDKFKDIYQITSQQLKDRLYVDDLGLADETGEALRVRTQEAGQ